MDKLNLGKEATEADVVVGAQASRIAWKSVRHTFILWVLFFLVCLGLGYPTLNRYDPRTSGGMIDSVDYYKLVTGGRLGMLPSSLHE